VFTHVQSLAFRRTARVFAALLLLWTAADLFGYGLCAHGDERIGALADTGLRAPSSERGCPRGGFDDCFCCSHVVDVRVPFHITLCLLRAGARPPGGGQRGHRAG
jgi:hypothetical protein